MCLSRERARLEFEIDIDLTGDELVLEIQIDLLIELAERMTLTCGEAPQQTILALLTAATVVTIRSASSGMGVAPELKELMIDAMKIARSMTAPPARQGI